MSKRKTVRPSMRPTVAVSKAAPSDVASKRVVTATDTIELVKTYETLLKEGRMKNVRMIILSELMRRELGEVE